MSIDEFNEKYKHYRVERSYGLDINDVDVITYLDNKFQELIKIPNFKYAQIKVKFGTTRFYVRPRDLDISDVEKEIDSILLKKQNQ